MASPTSISESSSVSGDGGVLMSQHTEEEKPELQRLASVLSTALSRVERPNEGSLEGKLYERWAEDKRLDPKDAAFDFPRWAKTLFQTLESQGLTRPRSGFTFKNLTVSGNGETIQYQLNVGALPLIPFRKISGRRHHVATEKRILNDFNGTVNSGEMLVVLGRPGSGCSTFLKSICGELKGLKTSPESEVHYHGVPQKTYVKELRGDVVYNQENEQHFPQLTVGQTLRFAAGARWARGGLLDLSRAQVVDYAADIAMSVFGLRHVRDTRVGNDFIRGVSGGERKRVSIAEMAVSRAPIAAWDNSTKGLDAATALNFVQSLKVASQVWGTTHAVAIYQASQNIYDLFDKVVVLYEGRQVYFGPAQAARTYFENMGYQCPARQTTPDFLTAVTNPSERQMRQGFESKVPRTAEEFERYWQQSSAYQECVQDIAATEKEYPVGGHALEDFRAFHHQSQAKHTRNASPYRISIPMQVRLCMTRNFQLMWNDKVPVFTRIFTQVVLSLIIGSIFYGTPNTTSGFYAKGSILFMSVLINAFMCISEISALFSQRPIVQKHFSYAFYHPFAEALASVIADLPIKLICLTAFSVILYFLGSLRYQAGPFFVFFLFSLSAVLTMSAIFRTIAAAAKIVAQAMMIAGIMILAIAMYTGFTIQTSYMHPWFRWINYVNPVAYAFEALLTNEVHGQSYPCTETSLVPPYGTGDNFQCAVSGSKPGNINVSGDDWVNTTYGYSYSNLWRNFGILMGFMICFYTLYLVLTEKNSQSSSTGERLIFKRGSKSHHRDSKVKDDEMNKSEFSEGGNTYDDQSSMAVEKKQSHTSEHKDIFSWKDVTFDIPVKDGQRRLLDHVSGWVKPGTLTALMGVSGAGKTTLLDTLAQRIKIGVITGDMLVNGRPLDSSFSRRTGYVQQQDLHLETATVREALQFSAVLRQPKSTPLEEKYAWVEEVIMMLEMADFSEAVVGVPGDGLNVEQRKRLTIGVELAAKPSLLLFLDEPTSGLDSTSAWSIMMLMRRVADSGQAVLSTIHQPSTMLFQQFDRLLFLAKGGRTVYFGDVGHGSRTLLDYFETGGARKCGTAENPAEYILDLVSGSGEDAKIDWPQIWNSSKEKIEVSAELDRMLATPDKQISAEEEHTSTYALPLTSQIMHVTKRTLQQYYRTPRYVMGKLMLAIMSSLFTGFTFYNQNTTQAGLQNTLFAIFMVTTVFTPLVQQIFPQFITQRTLYEVRERPSRTYSWIAFLISNFTAEILYQMLAAILVFVAWYFAVFGATQSSLVQGLMLVLCLQFYLFVATFAFMIIAALPDTTTAANVATLLFSMMLIFNGTLQVPSALPGFWKFMWRTSPLTYLMGAWAANGLSGRQINCSKDEMAIFNPPTGATCGDYLKPYFQQGAPGKLSNPSATANCEYCPLSNADQFLAASEIYHSDIYRNIGLVFIYIVFNLAMAVLLYYVFRVRNGRTIKKVVRRFKEKRGSK